MLTWAHVLMWGLGWLTYKTIWRVWVAAIETTRCPERNLLNTLVSPSYCLLIIYNWHLPSAGAELTLSDSVCLPPEVLCCVTARSWGHLWDQLVMHIPGCPIPALMDPCHCGKAQFGTQGWDSRAERRAAVVRGDGREQNIALLCNSWNVGVLSPLF